MKRPAQSPICPVSSRGETCNPKTAEIVPPNFSKIPDAITAFAPPGTLSSAG